MVARPLAFGSLPAPMHTRWVCIWVPLRGTHYRSRFSFILWSHVHSPSARYRLQCTPDGCAYGCPSGAPIKTREKGNPFGDIIRVNFGQNYRDLGPFVRVTFRRNYLHPIGYPHAPKVLPSATLRGLQWVPYLGTTFLGFPLP